MTRKYTPESKYQLSNFFAVLLLLLIVFVSVGYFLFLGRPDVEAARLAALQELEAGRALWASKSRTIYRYVVDRDCQCPAETDQAYIATIGESGRSAAFPIPVESSAGILLTAPVDPVWIEDLFTMVERTLQGGNLVDVRYNYLNGYPEVVDLNPGSDSAKTTDRFEVRDFEVLMTNEN